MRSLRNNFSLRVAHKKQMKTTACEKTVAIAAPAAPHPKVKMHSGSRTKLSSRPIMVAYILILLRPSTVTRLVYTRVVNEKKYPRPTSRK